MLSDDMPPPKPEHGNRVRGRSLFKPVIVCGGQLTSEFRHSQEMRDTEKSCAGTRIPADREPETTWRRLSIRAGMIAQVPLRWNGIGIRAFSNAAIFGGIMKTSAHYRAMEQSCRRHAELDSTTAVRW
jgi:hypothetical protein